MNKTFKINKNLVNGFKIVLLILIMVILWAKLYDQISWNEWAGYIEKESLFFILILILLPLNIGLESVKWSVILSPKANISPLKAVASVLSGYAVGFVLPNRIGSFLGRVALLKPEERVAGSFKSIYNNFAQLIITLVMGLLVIHEVANYHEISFILHPLTLFFYILTLLIFHIIYFYPFLIVQLTKWIFKNKLYEALSELTNTSIDKRIWIYVLSLLRYLVFSSQFILALYLFQVDISFWEAGSGVILIFFISSMIPVFFLGKIFIRESIAIFIFSFWTQAEVQVFYASITVWIINLVIPSIFGGYIFITHRMKLK